MKILYIERSLPDYSPVYDHIKRLKKHHETFALSIDQKSLPATEHIIRVRSFNFPKLERAKFHFFYKSVLKGLDDNFGNISFDLIHAHFGYPEGLAAYKLAKRLNIPYIITLRGSDVLLYPKRNKYLFKMISNTIQNANGIIGLSNDICDVAIKMGANKNNIVQIPEGYDDSVFNINQDGIRKNQIIFVGNLVPVKNIESLIKAFSLIIAEDKTLILIIIGKGELEIKLKALVGELKIKDQVNFLGFVQHDQLCHYYNQSRLLLLTSWSEGAPNVIQEAFGCGLPVVASNVGGIPELILEEENGLLCDPFSIEDIYNKIKTALNFNWNYQLISESSLRFTKNKVISEILTFYKNKVKSE